MKLIGGGIGLVDVAGQNIRNTITGENKPIDYNTDAMVYSKAAGTIRNTVAQNIVDATGYIDLDEEDHPILSRLLNGKSLADVYQFGMGMLDSAAVAALAAINPVLGKAGVALLATSSGTDAMLDAVSRGASDEQALTMGLLTAGFEMIFEKYELESLLGQGTNVWQALWRQGLSEAVGEGATETANILADIAVMAEKSDWQKNINRYLSENPDWDYRQAEKQAFIDAALQVGEASFGGLISGSAMGSTYAANTRFNQADVTKRLMDKGFNPEKAATMADAITARLNGQELTRQQTDRLRSAMDNAVVRDVMADITKKQADGIDNAPNNMYDDINIRDGITNDENAAFSNQNNATATENVITDGSHLENGKLKPNVTYKTGEHDYFYTTNEDGLIVNARTDDLQSKTHEDRLNHNPNTYGKEIGDHAGHLFGDRFGGSPELDNLVSQAKNVNLSEYKVIENQWAKALENGQKVRVNIDIHYDEGGVRPSSFDVSYMIDDVSYHKIISNK